jgi:hypothetical protein
MTAAIGGKNPRHPPARTVRSQITSTRLENIEPHQDMDKYHNVTFWRLMGLTA